MVVGGLVGDLLRTAGRKGDNVMRAQLIRLETVMLNSIELFADGAGMGFSHITNALEVGAVGLRSLCETLVQQGLHAVAIQSMLVFDLGIAVTFHTFDLTQVLGMRRIWPSQHLKLAIKLGDPFVIYPVMQ